MRQHSGTLERKWNRQLTRPIFPAGQTHFCSPFHSSLCPYFVCPTNISESMLVYAASLHVHNRLPVSFPHVLYATNGVCGTVLCVIYLSGSHVIQVWCWSHPHTGVSLTRGALPVVEDQSEAPDPKYVHLSLVLRSPPPALFPGPPIQPFVTYSKWKLDRVLRRKLCSSDVVTAHSLQLTEQLFPCLI